MLDRLSTVFTLKAALKPNNILIEVFLGFRDMKCSSQKGLGESNPECFSRLLFLLGMTENIPGVAAEEESTTGLEEAGTGLSLIDAENSFDKNMAAHVMCLMDLSPTLEQLAIDADFAPPGLVVEAAQNPSTLFPEKVEEEKEKGKASDLGSLILSASARPKGKQPYLKLEEDSSLQEHEFSTTASLLGTEIPLPGAFPQDDVALSAAETCEIRPRQTPQRNVTSCVVQ
jgi:hypothetical protein